METIPEYLNDEETESETEESSKGETQEGKLFSQGTDPGSYRINSADNALRSSFSSVDTSRLSNVWTLNINGAQYKVCFPRTDDLVEIDGVLVNIGSSNITGVVVGDSMNLGSYFQRTFTVAPLGSNTAQNNAWRYGAHSYMSTYSETSSGYSLSVVNDYGDANVVSRARLGSSWSTVNVIIIGLLALQVLISFVGGLLKRG